MTLARIGATPKGGVCRLAPTDLDRQAREQVIAWAREAGMTITIDRIGNCFMRRPGRNHLLPPVMTGSHIDTQPTGGKFDSNYGVLAGLEVVRTLKDHGIQTEAPIEVAFWTNEEGSRFVPVMMGSGVFAKAFTLEHAYAAKDADGKTVRDELERIGFVGTEEPGDHPIGAYFEAHIEQGPVLEDARVTCINYHSPGIDSDERSYARLAAARAQRELIERERIAGFRLESILHAAPTPTPGNHVGRMGSAQMDAEVAAAHGASALFTGGGGDQLFFEFRQCWPAADYLCLRGLDRGFTAAAMDAARLGQVSVWRAMRLAVADLLHGRASTQAAPRSANLFTEAAVAQATQGNRFRHPALQPDGCLPIGKRTQARQLMYPMNYYDPFEREAAPEMLNPLLSQPLVELCLRIPTYVLTQGGRGRALARRAFAAELPPEIATRRSKGGMEEHIRAVLLDNLDFITSLPRGYDTQVGERGLRLSGGERQRVAIARAVLKCPQIYVFDEATSMLDSQTEAALLQDLKQVCLGCTTLIVAHRLSTVQQADEIVVLDKGRVCERGSHAALRAAGGPYARLWRAQMGLGPAWHQPAGVPASSLGHR